VVTPLSRSAALVRSPAALYPKLVSTPLIVCSMAWSARSKRWRSRAFDDELDPVR